MPSRFILGALFLDTFWTFSQSSPTSDGYYGLMSQCVFLLESQPEIAVVCANALRMGGFGVHIFGSVGDFLAAAWRDSPDLAVIGLAHSAGAQLDILARLRTGSDCLVLLTSADASETERIEALEQGGDDYLMKPFSARELLSRARALIRRKEWKEEVDQGRRQVERCGDLCLDLDGKTISFGDKREALTSSEFSILRRMMRTPTKVFSRDELLQPPYRKRGESHRAIDMHVANLRRKIGSLRPGPNALVPVRGVGYRLKV